MLIDFALSFYRLFKIEIIKILYHFKYRVHDFKFLNLLNSITNSYKKKFICSNKNNLTQKKLNIKILLFLLLKTLKSLFFYRKKLVFTLEFRNRDLVV